jgi:hypothetical protein
VPNEEGNANQRKRYVSRPSTLFLSTNVFCLSARNSEKRIAKDLAVYSQLQLGLAHRTVSGAPGWSSVKRPLSRFDGDVRLKFTGPSDGASDCPVSRPR